MPKYTSSDIKRLAAAMRRNRDDEKPFTLLSGAGCSKSAGIPLARDLIREIHNKFSAEIEHRLDAGKRNDYGACMSCLSRAERKTLLEPYLSGAKVNWAHIAIATMMHAGFIDRVLTFNFDSVLARACGLLGLYPATYDFTISPYKETSYLVSQAIIHLHGQGTGMVMLNSDEETRQHANNLRPLLRRILKKAPLLVIGYSGTADAVFPVIREEFEQDQRLYWALYDDHPDSSVAEFIQRGGHTSEALCGADADRFLLELASELGCFPPKLFTDPYGHLLEELQPVCDFPLDSSNQQDILRRLRDDLVTAQSKHASAKKGKPDLEEMLMKSDWDGVIQHANPDEPDDQYWLAWAYIQQGDELDAQARSKQGKEADDLWQAAYENYAQAIAIQPGNNTSLYNWGNGLCNQASGKEGAEEQKLLQEACKKYAQAIAIKQDDHEALNNWGAALSALARGKGSAEKQELLQAACEKFVKAIAIKPDKSEALSNWALAIIEQSYLAQSQAERNKLLEDAAEKCRIANELAQGAGSYNLACIESLRGNFAESLTNLEFARQLDKLDPKHMLQDRDLAGLRETAEFADWLNKRYPELTQPGREAHTEEPDMAPA